MTIDWQRFGRIVQTHERFLLTSHVRPDCDALGSELGLALGLESLGKQVRIVNNQPTPPNIAFIDPDQRIEAYGVDVSAADLADRDCLIILDTSAWIQLDSMEPFIRASPATRLVIDHHVSEDQLDAELFKDVTSESTGRLIVEALTALDVPLTAAMAAPLFAAMATDSGWFRFPACSAETYRAAAQLIDAGAVPQDIFTSLYERESLARVQLRGRILARTELHCDGRLAATVALREDFEKTDAVSADTEDAVNFTLRIAGVEAAVIFSEHEPGRCKLSFRSRPPIDVSKVAAQFGGGGHQQAAGASLEGGFQQWRDKVLDAMRTAMG